MAKRIWHGIDASNEISLGEYGLLVTPSPPRNNSDAKDLFLCAYSLGNDMFELKHMAESTVNGYIEGKEFPNENDIASFLSWTGETKSQWLQRSFVMKLHDLLQFWGYQNIFGTGYDSPMTKDEIEVVINSDTNR